MIALPRRYVLKPLVRGIVLRDSMATAWRMQRGFELRMDLSSLWVPATLAASAAQTSRNATQRSLTETIGTVGATQVRFLYGFPFALLFLAVMGPFAERLPGPNLSFLLFILMGAVTQIFATALMLAAMRERSFSVVTAYIKTEP